jgi:hypothetical protein
MSGNNGPRGSEPGIVLRQYATRELHFLPGLAGSASRVRTLRREYRGVGGATLGRYTEVITRSELRRCSNESREQPFRPAAGPSAAQPADAAQAPQAAWSAWPPGSAEAARSPSGWVNVDPWWKRWPDRLDWEIGELKAAAMRPQVRDIGEDGIVRVDLTHTVDGVNFRLEAAYPHLFPYFRPLVRAAAGTFRFHQEPFGGGLCLAARDPEFWHTSDSLAAFVASQLPLIVRANADDDAGVAEIEEHVPEPVGPNYAYVTPDSVLIDSGWHLPADVDGGTLKVGLCVPRFPLHAAVLEVRGPDNVVLCAADPRLTQLYSAHTFTARWARQSSPIMGRTPAEFAEALGARDGDILRRGRWATVGGQRFDILGVVYEEEIRYLNYGDDWVFLLRVEQPRPNRARKISVNSFLVRALRAGPSDLALRIPQLSSLGGRKVAIVGLGALGAPAALAFGRAGVAELSLLDHDIVDAGTSPRWPHGLRAAGHFKIEAIQALVSANWPYTHVRGLAWRLGDIGVDADSTDTAVLNVILEGVDLIFDATANTAANHALADIAWHADLPYVVVSATEGAWGGIVARIERGRTGCFQCFFAALGGNIPLPPADNDPTTGRITPVACSDTTFTGAGFDLTPLADEAVRVAVSRLCEGADGGYPPVGWDVATVGLRDEEGNLTVPTWAGYKLPSRPTCSCAGG